MGQRAGEGCRAATGRPYGCTQQYYAPLETLLTLVHFPNLASDSFDRTLRERSRKSRPHGRSATRQLGFPGTTDTLE